MQLTLSQAELNEAVRDYIAKSGFPVEVGDMQFEDYRGETVVCVDVTPTTGVQQAEATIKPAPAPKAAEPKAAKTEEPKEEPVVATIKPKAVETVTEDPPPKVSGKSLFS